MTRTTDNNNHFIEDSCTTGPDAPQVDNSQTEEPVTSQRPAVRKKNASLWLHHRAPAVRMPQTRTRDLVQRLVYRQQLLQFLFGIKISSSV